MELDADNEEDPALEGEAGPISDETNPEVAVADPATVELGTGTELGFGPADPEPVLPETGASLLVSGVLGRNNDGELEIGVITVSVPVTGLVTGVVVGPELAEIGGAS